MAMRMPDSSSAQSKLPTPSQRNGERILYRSTAMSLKDVPTSPNRGPANLYDVT
jgi:hypothetical protein